MHIMKTPCTNFIFHKPICESSSCELFEAPLFACVFPRHAIQVHILAFLRETLEAVLPEDLFAKAILGFSRLPAPLSHSCYTTIQTSAVIKYWGGEFHFKYLRLQCKVLNEYFFVEQMLFPQIIHFYFLLSKVVSIIFLEKVRSSLCATA